MKVGAERNKVILLSVLAVLAAYFVYSGFAEGEAGPTRVATPSRQEAASRAAATQRKTAVRGPRTRIRGQQFRPTFSRSGDEPPLDPMEFDPTLRTDLLAAVRGVEFGGVERNIFQFTERKLNIPPPKQEDVDRAQQLLAQSQKAAPPPSAPAQPVDTKPRAPKITWKYYGYATEAGASDKRAFLQDGEEIFVATEGDVFKRRYRIVKIGVNSIVVEDLEFKDEQTLPLEQKG